MELVYFFLILVIAASATILIMKLKKDKNSSIPPQATPMPEEVNTIDLPVEPNPEPTQIGEMPIKPAPVNCQFAIFRPAPEKYFYTDCCGNPQSGEGFQPWEKRTPVSIDTNKEFEGMDLIGEEAQFDC